MCIAIVWSILIDLSEDGVKRGVRLYRLSVLNVTLARVFNEFCVKQLQFGGVV